MITSSVRVAFAALAVLATIIATVLSSSLSTRAQSADETGADILNHGVYRIVARVYSLDRFGDLDIIQATGIMVKEPNKILTVALPYDGYANIYDNARNGPYYLGRIQICEHEADRNMADSRRKEEETREREDHSARLKEVRERLAPNKRLRDDAFKKLEEDSYRKAQEKGQFSLSRACSNARVTEIDVNRRLVLLDAEERLKGQAPRFSWAEAAVGSTVRAYGFPAAADRSEFMPRRSTSSDRDRLRLVPSQTSGTVVKNNAGDDKEGQLVMHQVPIADGAWGGPLINACNQVVGLNWKPQDIATLIEAKADTKQTGRTTAQAQVTKRTVATSNVMVAVGGREIISFADLKGISLSDVTREACQGPGLVDNLRQNPVVLLGVVSALLLAAASLVVALRRPAVRQTLMRVSGMGRAKQADTFGPGYGGAYAGGYAGAAPQPTSDYAPYAPTAAPTIETLPAAPPPPPGPAPASSRAADVTRAMADQGYSDDGGGGKLVPLGGGTPLLLDSRRLGYDGLVVGRETDCDLVVNNSTVSKRHARISRTDNGKLLIEDLGSANGTWRGKLRIQREAFGSGDVVRFGSQEYRVEIAARSGDRAAPTLMMTPVSAWMLSGFDEEGRVVQWQLQPTIDSSGRGVETNWIVGRSSERADKVLVDKRVSAQHAKIRYTPQRGLEICDLGSSNGTKVDGRKITDAFVQIDDARVIELGGSKMTLSKS